MNEVTLNDLRRFAVRASVKVEFEEAAAHKCLMDAKGILRVPGINGPLPFTVDKVLAEATQFAVIPGNPKEKPYVLDRAALAEAIKAIAPASPAAPAKDE
jgi:hypothetical protein